MPISKAEFARRRNVSRSRVGQWIREGRISGPALVGLGPRTQIDEDLAIRQLDERLDVGQRHGNGAATDLASDYDDGAASVSKQILEQKLQRLRRENLEAEISGAIAGGQLCSAADARRASASEISRLLVEFEGSMPGLASAIAGRFKLPTRDVLHLMRTTWGSVRKAASIAIRERAEHLPEAVGFNLARDEETEQ